MKKPCPFLIFVYILFSFSFIMFSSNYVEAKPIQLKAITSWPSNIIVCAPFNQWVERINRECAGELEIKVIGGPEAVPSFQQAEALRGGTVDIIYTAPPYFKGLVPEMQALSAIPQDSSELRESGVHGLLNETCIQKMNSVYLADFGDNFGNVLLLNKKISSPDLSGMKIRDTVTPFVKALGATAVNLPPSEVYSAMERGVIDGLRWPAVVIRNFKLQEVSQYVVDHHIWKTGSTGSLLMNYDQWNSLPKELKDKIVSISKDEESKVEKFYLDTWEQEVKPALISEGVEFIYFDPEDAEKYHQIAIESMWEYLLNNITGESIQRLKEMADRQ